jgi:hypothetical protein
MLSGSSATVKWLIVKEVSLRMCDKQSVRSMGVLLTHEEWGIRTGHLLEANKERIRYL